MSSEDSGRAAELEPEKTSLSSQEKKFLFLLEDDLELEILEWRLSSAKADHKQGELQELPELKI